MVVFDYSVFFNNDDQIEFVLKTQTERKRYIKIKIDFRKWKRYKGALIS